MALLPGQLAQNANRTRHGCLKMSKHMWFLYYRNRHNFMVLGCPQLGVAKFFKALSALDVNTQSTREGFVASVVHDYYADPEALEMEPFQDFKFFLKRAAIVCTYEVTLDIMEPK